MRDTGVWRLSTPDRQTVYYVVQPDPREADLTPFNDKDREAVGKHLPFSYQNDAAGLIAGLSKESRRQEFWWWFLLGLVGLLCVEVWFTRRIVKNRAV
jgi:hypothetical protein